MKNLSKTMTITNMFLIVMLFFISCGEPALLENNMNKVEDGDRQTSRPHHRIIRWEIEDNAFVHHIDKTFQRDRGTLTINSDKSLQLLSNGQVIQLNDDDKPFGVNGVFHQADSGNYEESNSRMMTGNDGKEINNINQLSYSIDIMGNGSSEKNYTVNGTFTSNVTSNFDAPNPAVNHKKRMLFDILKSLPLRKKLPQSGEITISINLSNNGVDEQHTGKILFDGDYTITLEIDGESREIDLKKLHRKPPRTAE